MEKFIYISMIIFISFAFGLSIGLILLSICTKECLKANDNLKQMIKGNH